MQLNLKLKLCVYLYAYVWKNIYRKSCILLTGKLKYGFSAKNTSKSIGCQALIMTRIFCFNWIVYNEGAFDQTVAIITLQIYFWSISKPSYLKKKDKYVKITWQYETPCTYHIYQNFIDNFWEQLWWFSTCKWELGCHELHNSVLLSFHQNQLGK